MSASGNGRSDGGEPGGDRAAANGAAGAANGGAGGAGGGLDALFKAAGAAARETSDIRGARGIPPVEKWNPPFCGDLDIRIKRDGSWHYLGTPIGREAIVRLFGTILRKDEDGRTYLVTPVEKVGIIVEDAHFIGVDAQLGQGAAEGAGQGAAEGAGREAADAPRQTVTVETNHGDRAVLGPDHPLRLEHDPETGEPAPYILVRGRLEARLDRKCFFRLVDMAQVEDRPEGRRLGVWSSGVFYDLADAAEFEDG